MYYAIGLQIRVYIEEKELEPYVEAESLEASTVTLGNSDLVCEVVCVAHGTKDTLSVLQIGAIIIITRVLRRSCGRARLMVLNLVSFLCQR